MVFLTEKIPYGINVGLDLSDVYLNQSLFDAITKLEEFQIDYLVNHVSIENSQIKKDYLNSENFNNTIYLDEYLLFSNEWKNKFVGKLYDEDIQNINNKNSHELLQNDIEYNYHVNSRYIITTYPKNSNQRFSFNKLLRKFINDYPERHVNIIIDFSKEGLSEWKQIQSELGYLENVGIVLNFRADLPEQNVLMEFVSHNLKSMMVPLSIFVTNKNGFPVLSKLHQDYIKFLFSYRIDLIIKDDFAEITIQNFSKITDYKLYLYHIFTTHKVFQNEDYVLCNYLDVFQVPLQPLRDNLQSQTYECFEEDNMKYDMYEKALERALTNYKNKGFLNLKNCNDSNQMIVDNNKRVLNGCVLGGGRGPLVRKLIKASKTTNVEINVTCVEKNRNAYNTLLFLKKNEPETFGNVNFILSDMREYKPMDGLKFDIVISELLGSFGDNELSPECLLNIQNYLTDDSIMVPHSYTSYVRPVTCPVIWSNVFIILLISYF